MLEEADYSVTDMALGRTGANEADKVLAVRFFRHPVRDAEKSEAEGRPIFTEKDYVEISIPGNKDHIVCHPVSEKDKMRFPEHWRLYTARVSQEVVQGTPLEEWPGITRGQVEELRFLNVRTVEQLAAVSDANGQRIMGINSLKDKAKAYLEQAKGQSAEMDALKAQNADLMARLERLEQAGQTGAPHIADVQNAGTTVAEYAAGNRGPDATATAPRRRQRGGTPE